MNAGGPLVSIVINNYNYGRFLPDAVGSALAQTYAHVEVIVVDDGSTDGSGSELARWSDRVQVVLKENGGQASALNAGWDRARGDVVMLLDADDALLPDTAERVVAACAPPLAAVWLPVALAGPRLAPLGRTLPPDRMQSGDLSSLCLAGVRVPAPPTSGIALVRPLADALFPIPEGEWRISADAYLSLLTPLAGPVAALALPGALYRFHGNNRCLLGEGLSLPWLHEQLRIDRRREAALRTFANRLGRTIPDGWLERGTEHLQTRLASLRLDPATHPVVTDRRLWLAGIGALRALRTPTYALRKRVLFAAWFLLAALLPAGAALPLVEASYRARRRPWPVRLLLGDVNRGAMVSASDDREQEQAG